MHGLSAHRLLRRRSAATSADLQCLSKFLWLVLRHEPSATGVRSSARVEFDLRGFCHNETILIGADSRKLDVVASARIMGSLMVEGFEAGRLQRPVIAERFRLADGRAAREAVGHDTAGRMVITPMTGALTAGIPGSSNRSSLMHCSAGALAASLMAVPAATQDAAGCALTRLQTQGRSPPAHALSHHA